MRFIDDIQIVLASGSGGNGCVSFRRESLVPRGGPDGGDGGRGGDLVLEASRGKNTLSDFRSHRVYRAANGQPGKGKKMHGHAGADLVLEVPVGTIVHHGETDEILADLDREGARFVIPGGRGGAGNVHFKSATMRTPRFAKEGREGVELPIRLELKLIADVGLLGFPNAGKSTLIQRITRSQSEIGAHPFTTLNPQLGVVHLHETDPFIVADMPGLVEGAAEGVGLGLQFLRHVERCKIYVHLISAERFDGGPAERYRALREEMRAYDPVLLTRPELVALTKVDLLDDDERAQLVAELQQAVSGRVFQISSVSDEGLVELVLEMHRQLRALDPEPSAEAPTG